MSEILLVLIWVAAGAFTAAAIAYHILAPWTETQVGRWYMFLLTTIALSLDLILLNRVLHLPGIALILVIYGLFAAAGLGTLSTILMTQLRQRHDERADK